MHVLACLSLGFTQRGARGSVSGLGTSKPDSLPHEHTSFVQSCAKDTPEYFWEEDAWQPAYEALCAYLDIPLRVDNLNKRLVR